MASVNIGGATIHSFSGVGNGMQPVEVLCSKVDVRPEIQDNWRDCQVLIIDEVSMLDSYLFDKIEHVARYAREKTVPFGGLQVIVCGDFFQLPPVAASDPKAKETGEKFFAFESETWRKTIACQVTLRTVHRQKEDREFVQMLSEIRHSRMSQKTLFKLREKVEEPKTNDEKVPRTKLFAYRDEVKSMNNSCLEQLKSPPITYIAEDKYKTDEGKALLRSANLRCEKEVTLKLGATVMCIANVDVSRGLANGSIGLVVAFGRANSTLQLPPGQRFTNVIQTDTNTEETFDMLNQEIFRGDEAQQNATTETEVSSDVKRKADIISKSTFGVSDRNTIFPWVRFDCGDYLLNPMTFPIDNSRGVEIASRKAMPLILGFSMTIHKSQGSTLTSMETSLSRAFDCGMAYVALSRCRNLKGLRLLSFNPKKVRTHPKVIQYEYSTSDERETIKARNLTERPRRLDDPIQRPKITRKSKKAFAPRRRSHQKSPQDASSFKIEGLNRFRRKV